MVSLVKVDSFKIDTYKIQCDLLMMIIGQAIIKISHIHPCHIEDNKCEMSRLNGRKQNSGESTHGMDKCVILTKYMMIKIDVHTRPPFLK